METRTALKSVTDVYTDKGKLYAAPHFVGGGGGGGGGGA